MQSKLGSLVLGAAWTAQKRRQQTDKMARMIFMLRWI
jgi:hypothetical protein